MRPRAGELLRRGLIPTLVLSFCLGVALAQDPLRERVLENATGTYVHGMTEEIADREFGSEAVPYLLELLDDPEFERRDNVVAILGYLGGEQTTSRLLSFLADPPADLADAVEDRATLLAPQSLGQIASRGNQRALQALLEMTAPDSGGGPLAVTAVRATYPAAMLDDLVQMALRGLAYSGAPEARGRLDAISQGTASPVRGGRGHRGSAESALELFDRLHTAGGSRSAGEGSIQTPVDGAASGTTDGSSGGESPAGTGALDPNHFNVMNSMIDYVNHVNVTDPMTDSQLDDRLGSVSLRMGKADFDGDVACCSGMVRNGSGQFWGNSGDGLDIIDNSTEMKSVLNASVARFKVVRAINYCGGAGTNIIGCGWVGGDGAAVVRFGGIGSEGALWGHEYGHNTGLFHNSQGGTYIMYGFLGNSNTGLTQSECDKYHTPNSGTQADSIDAGNCTDGDLDDVQDMVDNCPGVANHDQTDSDGDGVGDVCEGGCGNGVVDEGEQCDGSDLGGQTCSDFGHGGGSLACNSDCTVDDSGCSTCGNGVQETGEECDGTDLGGASCSDLACTGGTPTCTSCTVDYVSCTGCPACDNDGICEADEDCNDCPADCVSGAGAACGNGVCESADGEDCLNCPSDCRGKQNGNPGNRFCCGAGGGDGPVPCSDPACNGGSAWACTDLPVVPSCCGDLVCDGIESGFNCEIDCGPPPFCGDGICNGGEDSCSCNSDCGPPPMSETGCSNGVDDDCDGSADCSDSECSSADACQCEPLGASCSAHSECCSKKCRGKPGNKVCK